MAFLCGPEGQAKIIVPSFCWSELHYVARVIILWCIPSYSQGRKILFDSKTNDGKTFIDALVPSGAIDAINNHEMKIRFKNGSVIACVGSDNPSSLVGVNLFGAVFSEYAISDENAYKLLRPSLTQTGGFAVFISTPRQKNWLWDLLQIARANPKEWYSEVLTIEDTKHIPLELIEQERASGELSEELIRQEYYCSFCEGVREAWYTESLDKMRREDRITDVPYNPQYKVHVSFDLGIGDDTSLVFWQNLPSGNINVIDAYCNRDKSLVHYAQVLFNEKKYIYGDMYCPHDGKVRELSSGMTRVEIARDLGIHFTMVPNVAIIDGIESVRASLQSRVWIDKIKCKELIQALEKYKRLYDPVLAMHRDVPVHDKYSNYADAFRYASLSFDRAREGKSAEELERIYREVRYGASGLPPMFTDRRF